MTIQQSVAAARAYQSNALLEIEHSDLPLLEIKRRYPIHSIVQLEFPFIRSNLTVLMNLLNDDPVALELFWKGTSSWEPGSLLLLSRLLDRGCKSFLDVGAFTGLYTLLAAKLGFKEITALEPSSLAFGRLVDNIKINGLVSRVKVLKSALSQVDGFARFTSLRPELTLSTSGSLAPRDNSHTAEYINTISFDSLCSISSASSYDVIKIDIEGFESALVDVVVEMVSKSRAEVIIEIKPSNLPLYVAALQSVHASIYSIDDLSSSVTRVCDSYEAVFPQNYLCSLSDWSS